MQVVRRLFLLVGTSAFVATGEGSGGLDIAVGPNVGCSPLGLLDPAVLLQGLLAGPGTEDPRRTPAALPLVGCWIHLGRLFRLPFMSFVACLADLQKASTVIVGCVLGSHFTHDLTSMATP